MPGDGLPSAVVAVYSEKSSSSVRGLCFKKAWLVTRSGFVYKHVSLLYKLTHIKRSPGESGRNTLLDSCQVELPTDFSDT